MRNRIVHEQKLSMDKGAFKQEIRVVEKLLDSGYWKVIFRFHLIGEKGAAQFVFHVLTKQPKEAEDFYHGRWEGFQFTFCNIQTPSGGWVMPMDLGFHSKTPDHRKDHFEDCPVLGGECWYDGSGYLASEVMAKFIKQRNFKVIWDELMDFYQSETTPTT